MDKGQVESARHVSVGTTEAHCTYCGGLEFLPARRRSSGRGGSLFCVACGAEHYYSALVRQIAGKVIEHSDELLKESERLRRELEALGRG